MAEAMPGTYTANATANTFGKYYDPISLLANLRVLMSFFTKYLWMVTVALGVPGNILTICISLTKENRKISTSIYIAAVAMADTMVLAEEFWGFCIIYWRIGTERPNEFALQ
jgi:hypothetical protein